MGEAWIFVPVDGGARVATLVGHTLDQAIDYAHEKGYNEVTEWRGVKQICTHITPKQTLGKDE